MLRRTINPLQNHETSPVSADDLKSVKKMHRANGTLRLRSDNGTERRRTRSLLVNRLDGDSRSSIHRLPVRLNGVVQSHWLDHPVVLSCRHFTHEMKYPGLQQVGSLPRSSFRSSGKLSTWKSIEPFAAILSAEPKSTIKCLCDLSDSHGSTN